MTLFSTETFERYALAGLRALAVYRLTKTADEELARPHLQSVTQEMRALGYALELRHLEFWDVLLPRAESYVLRALQHAATADDLLYGQSLALLLDLRHGPRDVRLAHPGVGRSLITVALGIEGSFGLNPDANPPAPLSITPAPLSSRDQLLLDVARHLAVLEFETGLPPGHRLTPADLLDTARTLRQAVQTICEARGQDPEAVWAASERQLARRAWSLQEWEEAIYTLYLSLELSLTAGVDEDSAMSRDGALALWLERLAAHVTALPPISNVSGAGRKMGVLMTQVTPSPVRWGAV